MNKPLQKLRRFFTRTKRLNATANPDALSAAYDDDDGASRLSGAFVVVLLLHIVALVGVFAFARIKDSRTAKANETKAPPGATPVPGSAAALGAAAGKNGNAARQPAATPASTPVPAPAAPTAPALVSHQNVPAAASIPVNETRANSAESAKAAGKGVHVVKNGETLTKIATANNISVTELVKANGLKNENDLRVGQELKIPEPGKTPAHTAPAVAETHPKATEEKATAGSGDSYTVKRGDNLTKISTNTGVKMDVLMRLNGIKDPKKLQEGQKLKLPKKG